MPQFEKFLAPALQNRPFTEAEMEECITMMMGGEIKPDKMGLLLISLAKRGETAEEIAGAARALRKFASTISAPDGAIDCCGTGGDGTHTYNISTAVALVAASCGAKIAKHGNRASTSKSGAADVLEKLGVNLSPAKDKLESALNDIGFCFLMAPNHHAAMKHIAPLRKMLGTRTIFNLLGPLANPAGTKKQLVGVFAKKWVMPMAQALKSLGATSALVVHGEDGLDEITLTSQTDAALLMEDSISQMTLAPEQFGLPRTTSAKLVGGDAEFNAGALAQLLKGEKSAYRDMVLANTAGVLYLHDGRELKKGVADAAAAIDSGAANDLLERYKAHVA